MFNFKKLHQLQERINKLEACNKSLSEDIVKILNNRADPIWVVQTLSFNKLKWTDIDKLTPNKRRAYCNQAKVLLDDDILKEILDKLEFDMMEIIAKNSTNHRRTRDLRMVITTVELIKKYLRRIANLEEIPNKEEIDTTSVI